MNNKKIEWVIRYKVRVDDGGAPWELIIRTGKSIAMTNRVMRERYGDKVTYCGTYPLGILCRKAESVWVFAGDKESK